MGSAVSVNLGQEVSRRSDGRSVPVSQAVWSVLPRQTFEHGRLYPLPLVCAHSMPSSFLFSSTYAVTFATPVTGPSRCRFLTLRDTMADHCTFVINNQTPLELIHRSKSFNDGSPRLHYREIHVYSEGKPMWFSQGAKVGVKSDASILSTGTIYYEVPGPDCVKMDDSTNLKKMWMPIKTQKARLPWPDRTMLTHPSWPGMVWTS